MGKAIAASALDQIADVLEHARTALLVKPGDPGELAEAIQRLACDAQLRVELGRNARKVALASHTWQQNAKRVLAYGVDTMSASDESSLLRSAVSVGSVPSRRTSSVRQNLR